MFPKLKRPVPPPELAGGLAGVVLAVADPNREGAPAAGVFEAFDPKREGCWAPDAGGFDWPPNKLEPGGGPAGVVELSVKVLFGAGVAVKRSLAT